MSMSKERFKDIEALRRLIDNPPTIDRSNRDEYQHLCRVQKCMQELYGHSFVLLTIRKEDQQDGKEK